MVVDMPLMVVDVVAMGVAAPMVLHSVTLTVRFWLVAAPERASSRFTLKLPVFSVSAVCSGAFRVNVCDWLLPLMARAACTPVGRVRDRRCWAPLQRYSCLVARAGYERRRHLHRGAADGVHPDHSDC